MPKQGKIIFISGPSGVGKGTLINALRTRHPDFLFPPSCTTRFPRPGEVNGRTYHFISRKEFEKKIKEGEFLEYAQIHGGHFYGTLQDELFKGVKNGKIVIREFDVQGFAQAREKLPREFYVSIFLQPAEDISDLVRRIRERAPISDEEVQKRIKSMEKEMAYSKYYDHVVVSHAGEIERLVSDTEKVIVKECEE